MPKMQGQKCGNDLVNAFHRIGKQDNRTGENSSDIVRDPQVKIYNQADQDGPLFFV
jgi:hypothetical protein